MPHDASNRPYYVQALPTISQRSPRAVCHLCGKPIAANVARQGKSRGICSDCGLNRAMAEHRRGFRY